MGWMMRMRPTYEYTKLMKQLYLHTASAAERNAQKKTTRVKRQPKPSQKLSELQSKKR